MTPQQQNSSPLVVKIAQKGKITFGILMLILGVLGGVASIAMLVFTISHSPNISFGEMMMASPDAWVLKREVYPLLLFSGWGSLLVSGILVLGGLFLFFLGAREIKRMMILSQ